jgi:hypothetical protein
MWRKNKETWLEKEADIIAVENLAPPKEVIRRKSTTHTEAVSKIPSRDRPPSL